MNTLNSSARRIRGAGFLWACALLLMFCSRAAHAQALDLSTLAPLTPSQAQVATAIKKFDPVKKETTYAFAFTNVSGGVLRGPVYATVALVNAPAGVTVKNAAGLTTTGVPYFIVSRNDIPKAAQLLQQLLFANPSNASFTFNTAAYAPPQGQGPPLPLQVQITHPGTLITVGSTPLPIDGTINDASATLTVNGAPITHSGGTFHASVALEEGHNAVIARAVNARGEEATATISVSLDRTAPYVTIESPVEGAVLTSSVITVSGLINDIVRGTVSEGQANVTVNGRAAVVANRSYLAQDVPLQEGPNTIRVEGADQVGNTSATEVRVTYEVPTRSFIEIAGGQAQHAQIREVVAQSLRARLVTSNGQPVAGKPVVFRVTQGDGLVGVGGGDEGTAILVNTDADGIASTRYKLGSRAGSGNHRVTAKAVGFEGEVVFVASATPKPGNKISVNSGNNQRGAANQPLPLPFVVVVSDDGANVIEGAEVEFTVVAGAGTFQNGQTHITATTDSDGRASAKLTLGNALGLDVQRVMATVVGRTELSAGFTASALQSGAPAATSISGVVLDNQDHPLPNVTMRVEHTTRQALTDDQGRFKITEVPVGPVHLIADGSTTTVPGEWPTLPYNIVTVSGADNPLSSPVYLVKLDTAHAVNVGEEDQDITLPEVPGFKLTVKAGSVTFPNGDRTGQISVTPVNASKIPMAPPNGMQPQFIVTIQPAGARFDPPAPLQLPNVDGHAPGAQVEMFSFDHDLEEFVAIGLGTVSSDGTVIKSNPGVGVIKAGWHGGSQPAGSGCAGDPPLCQALLADCNGLAANDNDPRVPRPAAREAAKSRRASAGGPTYNLLFDGPEQIPGDIPHDCSAPTCRGGVVAQVPSDDDQPESECSQCSSGEIVPASITEVHVTANSKDDDTWVAMGEDKRAAVNFNVTATAERCSNLTYSWNFGDGQSSTERAPRHLYTTPGHYTPSVTVSCEGCRSLEATDDVRVTILEVQHLTEVTEPQDRNRTDLGVGETVFLTILPADATVTVSLTGEGTLQADENEANKFSFEAGSVRSASSLEISAPLLEPMVISFEVFAPNRITFEQASVGNVPDGDAGMDVSYNAFLHAIDEQDRERTVSFYNIKVIDLAASPEDVQGYFATLPLPADFDSVPFTDLVSVVADRNKVFPPYNVKLVGRLFQSRERWARGSFVYRMTWQYVSFADPLSVRHAFAVSERSYEMEGTEGSHRAGTVTMFQDNVCYSRAPDGVAFPCAHP